MTLVHLSAHLWESKPWQHRPLQLVTAFQPRKSVAWGLDTPPAVCSLTETAKTDVVCHLTGKSQSLRGALGGLVGHILIYFSHLKTTLPPGSSGWCCASYWCRKHICLISLSKMPHVHSSFLPLNESKCSGVSRQSRHLRSQTSKETAGLWNASTSIIPKAMRQY